MKNKPYKVALVIGRFQPFHNGHKYLLLKALDYADKIVIGIGSSNRKNEDNPFTFLQRKKMLKLFIENEQISGRVIGIFPSPDVPDDNEWLKDTLKRSGSVDAVIGNNDWVKGIFENAGFSVIRIPYYKRFILEGQKIRKLMKNGKSWQNRVPLYISQEFSS